MSRRQTRKSRAVTHPERSRTHTPTPAAERPANNISIEAHPSCFTMVGTNAMRKLNALSRFAPQIRTYSYSNSMHQTSTIPLFTWSPRVAAFSIPLLQFQADRPDIHKLAAGALVFRRLSGTGDTQVLLLRRAPSNSFALKWELPGGSVEPDKDKTLLHTAVRELWEETGLSARQILCSVALCSTAQGTWTPDEQKATMDRDNELFVAREDNENWGRALFIIDVDEKEHGNVRVDQNEHSEWTWVTESEVVSNRLKSEGTKNVEWVGYGMRRILLDGFRLQKQCL